MPVRFETRRAPLSEGDLDRLGNTVVDLTPIVDELAARAATPARSSGRQTEAHARGLTHARRIPRRHRRGRPRPSDVDDAALFDPARCDFASLVKRLDEVATDD